jgi:type I restriction enzyme R subunit
MQFLRETPEKTIQRYKDDLAFFLKLRVSVKQRYAESGLQGLREEGAKVD